MNDFVLRAWSLSKKYGPFEAVRDATFTLSKNRITAFLGENGAGKTTTLKLILGFLRSDSGGVEIDASRIGYVPERPAFFGWLKGTDIIAMTARRYGIQRQGLSQRIGSLSERTFFDPRLLQRKVQTYSLGNQKKFSYLQSLLIDPDLLVVDEPFSSLDPASIKGIRGLFSELREKEKTILLSSHLISEVEKISDEFILIRQGRILVQENLRRLKERCLLVRLEKGEIEVEKLKLFSLYLREKDFFWEMLVEKTRLQELENFLGRNLGIAIHTPLDLETIFFFFA
jgi:ABC-2 type transport system ATP-binding protein